MNNYKISPAGLALIKNFEGLELTAYRCQADKPTIGWGSTAGVTMGMTITEAEAEALLKKDLAVMETAVKRAVRVQITQPMFDALVAFVFNLGETQFRASTMLRLINQRRFKEAAAQFDRWIYANKQKSNGLVRRRKAERKLFESGL
jgi:lysozyme